MALSLVPSQILNWKAKFIQGYFPLNLALFVLFYPHSELLVFSTRIPAESGRGKAVGDGQVST